MKAIISSTNDPIYSFFIPITAWCWNKLGVDVINFIPGPAINWAFGKESLIIDTLRNNKIKCTQFFFYCGKEKEATYAQCSRLYAAALPNLSDRELICTADVDMATFKQPIYNADMYIWGADLVPDGQYPMCYATAEVRVWKQLMGIGTKSVQECLDILLGNIDCENMRGNYWGKDQETLYNQTNGFAHTFKRARSGTQFASNRVDRDDINWRSYLGPDLVDAHLWRPGYTDENFANIMELLQAQYPSENFDWVRAYRDEYVKLL